MSDLQTKVTIGVGVACTAFFLAKVLQEGQQQQPQQQEQHQRKKRSLSASKHEMTISRLIIYPVKSMGGLVANEWPIGPEGLLFDRKWMVVRETPNEEGVHRKVSQREFPHMATITPELVLDENNNLLKLVLHKKDHEPLVVPTVDEKNKNEYKTVTVDIWDQIIPGGIDLGDACAEWCSTVIGVKCRLVYSPDSVLREIAEREHVQHLKAGEFHDRVWFADGFPYMLLTEELVEWCNKDCMRTDDTEIKANRFRPNILINGSSSPMESDTWRKILLVHSGEETGVVLDCVKPCTRCSMPNINQETGTRTKQPRPWLEEHRMGLIGKEQSSEACFGVNAVEITNDPHSASGTQQLRVGDRIIVLTRGEGLQ